MVNGLDGIFCLNPEPNKLIARAYEPIWKQRLPQTATAIPYCTGVRF